MLPSLVPRLDASCMKYRVRVVELAEIVICLTCVQTTRFPMSGGQRQYVQNISLQIDSKDWFQGSLQCWPSSEPDYKDPHFISIVLTKE